MYLDGIFLSDRSFFIKQTVNVICVHMFQENILPFFFTLTNFPSRNFLFGYVGFFVARVQMKLRVEKKRRCKQKMQTYVVVRIFRNLFQALNSWNITQNIMYRGSIWGKTGKNGVLEHEGGSGSALQCYGGFSLFGCFVIWLKRVWV